LTPTYILWYNYITEGERKETLMTYIDVYDDEDKLIRSFDIEDNLDWIEYLDWFDMQMSLGRFLYEITRYQED
jgi:hypothetical protein